MALITVSGQVGCRSEEVARMSARQLSFELVTDSRLATLIEEEFGAGTSIPEAAYADVMASILGRLATEHHLIFCAAGAELLRSHFRAMVRVRIVAPEPARIGNLMVDHHLDRPAARKLLHEMEALERASRKLRFGAATLPPHLFDLTLNAETFDAHQMVSLVEKCACSLELTEHGYLSGAVEVQLQFQMRLRLARHGIVPPGTASISKRPFAHHSEQIFANLLDFYRIAWEYEPRTFPIQWDPDGNASESFTPDFYLPELDQYIELTTMKQSLVTKKNRKVRLLRKLYPHVNIQVYYQKDIENLIFKYGLAGKPVKA
jgi:hypothetical protein